MVPAFISGEQNGSQVWHPLFLNVPTFALRVAKIASASSRPTKNSPLLSQAQFLP